MTNYIYNAIDTSGNRIEGKRQAESREAVLDFLNNKGLTVVNIREDVSLGFKNILSQEIGGMPLKDKVLVAKQMSTMISAGIPLIQAIGIMADQVKDNFKDKFNKVYKKVESGVNLSKSLSSVEGIFSDVQINLIAAGEKSGKLNEMLEKVADDLEKSRNLRGKIVGAMIYPAVIFAVLIVVVTIMILFMIPQIEELYQTLGQDDLPLITQILVSISSFVGSIPFIIVALVSITSIVLGYRTYVAKRERKELVDRLKLKIPVFGDLISKIQLTEFCRITSMLIQSGIPIIDAIDIVSKALSNEHFAAIVRKSKAELSKGSSLSLAIAKHDKKGVIPTILVQVIATGEESGKLDDVLDDMYKFYDAEVEQITSNLTKLLEPFILLLVGGLVAFLAIAIYYPIYTVGNAPALN